MAAAFTGESDDGNRSMVDAAHNGRTEEVMPEVEQEIEQPDESLDSLLSEEGAEVVEETPEKPEAETTEETEETPEGEETEESPPDSDKDKRDIPIQALLDEREKRQAAQKRADDLEKQIAELSKKPDDKRPDVFEDQDKYNASIDESIKHESLKVRMEISRDFMSMLKDDYAEREAEFLELAQDDAGLATRLKEHPNPARFAYETAVKANKLKEMGDVDEWREKEKARIREEVLKELEAIEAEGAEKDKQKRDSITPSLAKGRSAAGTSESTEDEALEDILKG
jgi:hypothetical protein